MEIYAAYRLSEYLAILIETVPIIAIHRKSGVWPSVKPKPGVGTKMLIYLVGSVGFVFKKSKIGACSFILKEESILRKTKVGEDQFDLNEIDCIHVLSNSYLIDLGKGAMPLPNRLFDRKQRKKFEEMYSNKLRRYKC